MNGDLFDLLETVSGPSWHWYVKRLSANDTMLKTNVHQAGPYMNRDAILDLFGSLARASELNPRATLPAWVVSDGFETDITVIWYNNKIAGDGTRNECRITGWGGKSSPVLDPEATGSLLLMAFHRSAAREDPDSCLIWLCSSPEEEQFVEDALATTVDPGEWIYRNDAEGELETLSGLGPRPVPGGCRLTAEELPEAWLSGFPQAIDIVEMAVARSKTSKSADDRLVARRRCEFALFRSLEDVLALPLITEGFDSIDQFVSVANTILQRRKSRSGRSLELHTTMIFAEEDVAFSYNQVSEGKKKPDFLFPSSDDYVDAAYPAERLRMLATKTTCKDRWRQILNEANRIPVKHLLTVQEGVTENQYAEMKRASVRLVVPRKLHRHYPDVVRAELLSLDAFIAEAKAL